MSRLSTELNTRKTFDRGDGVMLDPDPCNKRDAGAGPLHRVARDRQRAQCHSVKRVGEVDDRFTAGDLPGQLQRRLDRAGAGRAGELELVVATDVTSGAGTRPDPGPSDSPARVGSITPLTSFGCV